MMTKMTRMTRRQAKPKNQTNHLIRNQAKKTRRESEKKSGKNVAVSAFVKQQSNQTKPCIHTSSSFFLLFALLFLLFLPPCSSSLYHYLIKIDELPSVFRGKVIFVHPSTENQQLIERYVIAYDGTTDSGMGDDVTHVIIQDVASDPVCSLTHLIFPFLLPLHF